MKYRTSTINLGINGYAKVSFLIADTCPKCGVSNNPSTSIIGTRQYDDGVVVALSHRCHSCNYDHWSLQLLHSGSGKEPSLWAIWPKVGVRKFDKLIEDFSPRFVDMYHQAEAAELAEHYDLAGIGYRAAEEILIKDFAVEFTEDSPKKVAGFQLNAAIEHYFKSDYISGIATDVVRINGNDYAHWNRPKDFDSEAKLLELKTYLNIYIDQVLLRLRIEHPPVTRPQSHSVEENKN